MKYLRCLLLLVSLCSLFSGCESDKEIVVVEPVENYTQLFGLGTIFGWDSNSPTALTLIEQNVFTIDKVILYSEENKQFKFCLEKGDWDKVRYLVPTSTTDGTSVLVITPGEYDMQMCSEMTGNLLDHFWGIPQGADGTYRITVDVKEMKLTFEKISDDITEPEPEVPTIYGLGAAFGWPDSSAPVALTPDPETDGVYTTTLDLAYSVENKLFKFCSEKGAWDKIHYLVPAETDYNDNVKIVEDGEYDMFECSEMDGNLLDYFWGIDEGQDGKYELTVNTNSLKLYVKKSE